MTHDHFSPTGPPNIGVNHFLRGVVRSVRPGAQYEGRTHDYWMQFETSNGRHLRVFDFRGVGEGSFLAPLLRPGQFTELVLDVFDDPALPPTEPDPGTWIGRVVAADWPPARIADLRGHSYPADNLSVDSRILVETDEGLLLIGNARGLAVEPGLRIGWRMDTRYDLLAIATGARF